MSNYLFLDRWFSDIDDCNAMKKYIDFFIDQFSPSFQPTILKLLDKYQFYDEESIGYILREYKERIKKYIESNNIDKYIITLPFDKDSHNSYHFSSAFKSFDYKGNGEFIIRIKSDDFKECKNIIFVDDYSGTGSSFIDYFNKIREIIPEGTQVFFFPCFMTKYAKEKITNSNIGDFVTLSSDVSFLRTAEYLKKQEILEGNETQTLIDYSINSLRIDASMVLGYGNVEDLISLSYMTPNNTIGLFWWNENTLYRPLFQRNAFSQKTSIKQPRFKYDFIRAYNDSLASCTPPKMKEYLIIAVLLYFGYDLETIKAQCDFKNFKLDEGISYLKNKNILDNNLSYYVSTMKTYINLDNMIIYKKTGVINKKYTAIRTNLIKNI